MDIRSLFLGRFSFKIAPIVDLSESITLSCSKYSESSSVKPSKFCVSISIVFDIILSVLNLSLKIL